ncbi:MgtC/SapB family protein [Microbacteriaceae bacterium 4G12]
MVWQDIALRLFISVVVGALIGTERQWRHRMAGLRTNALVSLGACLFVLLSFMVTQESSPTRIAAQIVSGIGFLGGGVIIRDGFSIRGLNTAATLWCSAAVGTLVGSGFLKAALLGALGVLLANILLRPVALFMNKKSTQRTSESVNYVLSATCSEQNEAHIRELFMNMVNIEDIHLKELYSEDIHNSKKVTVRAVLYCEAKKDTIIEKIVGELSLHPDITAIGWKALPEQDAD